MEVWLDEHGREATRVGVLRPSFQGGRTLASSSFEYDAAYLRDPTAYELSPDLALVAGRRYTPESHRLFGAFSDSAPDEWGRKIVEANHRRRLKNEPHLPRGVGAFDLLLGVSDRTRTGALRFRSEREGEWLSKDTGVENLHELDRILAAAQRYEADEATDADLEYLGDVATSPGGARPKANVVTAAGGLAIAKLPHSKDGQIDVERWEALALELADRIGIHSTERNLHRVGNASSVLVVSRFDRTSTGDRLGYLSANSALVLGENHDRRGVTYQDFADTISELSANPAVDLPEMFARIALSVLINNVDDHWRNHGFIRVGGGWRLAPAFDVNPSRSSSVRARPITADDDPEHRDIRRLFDIAATFRLSPEAAAELIGRVADEVAGWRSLAERFGIPSAQQEAMAIAFDEGRLKLAREIATTPRPERRVSRPKSEKAVALDRLGMLLGAAYRLGVGSSVPSQMFTDAARRAGVSTAGSMPERAERVVTAAGLRWDPTFDSRESPSGGGSTVTLGGLRRMIEALETLGEDTPPQPT